MAAPSAPSARDDRELPLAPRRAHQQERREVGGEHDEQQPGRYGHDGERGAHVAHQVLVRADRRQRQSVALEVLAVDRPADRRDCLHELLASHAVPCAHQRGVVPGLRIGYRRAGPPVSCRPPPPSHRWSRWAARTGNPAA
jgi:hypothetical protein